MWTLLLIVAVAAYVWFFYTDRRNTITATKTSVSVAAGSIKTVAKAIKTEAEIAKTHNDIADLETDRLQKFAERNAERIVASMAEDIGLGKDFTKSQQARLDAVKARLEESKAKAKK